MKYLIVIFMTIVLTQNIFAQNAFFQRVKYDGKTSGIERVSPVKNKYMGLLVFNTGSTWGLFDSLGRLQSYSYIDSFDNKGYRVDYTHNHHSSYIIFLWLVFRHQPKFQLVKHYIWHGLQGRANEVLWC